MKLYDILNEEQKGLIDRYFQLRQIGYYLINCLMATMLIGVILSVIAIDLSMIFFAITLVLGLAFLILGHYKDKAEDKWVESIDNYPFALPLDNYHSLIETEAHLSVLVSLEGKSPRLFVNGEKWNGKIITQNTPGAVLLSFKKDTAKDELIERYLDFRTLAVSEEISEKLDTQFEL